jgi:hypothetical protein
MLRQALHHAEGSLGGWNGADPDTIAGQGRGSAAAGRVLAESLLPLMPAAHDEFVGGRGRLLDVGVGIGALTRQLCEVYPGTTAVGIDVLDSVVDVAREELAEAGLRDQVELRVQSVVDLEDRDAFDLAWLPQVFIPPADLREGLSRVCESLKPDRWLVTPISEVSRRSDEFQRAVADHGAHLTGGGPMSVDQMRDLLGEAGFVDVEHLDHGEQIVMLARRP